MTLSTTTSRVSYAGDGSTTAFTVPFLFLENGDVTVLLRDAGGTETDWTENTQYTLTGAGDAAGGALAVKTSPVDYTPAGGETLVIRRVVAETQGTDYPEGGAFPAAAHEQALDRLTMLVQQHSEALARSLRHPVSDSESITGELPNSVDRASLFLAFDASGNPIAAAGPADGLAVSPFAATLLGDFDAAAARDSLGAGPRRRVNLNGAFDHWSFGTSFSPTGDFTANRWYVDDAGLHSTKTVSRQSPGPAGFSHAMRVQRDAGETWTDTLRIGHVLPSDVSATLQGSTVTLSFLARKGADYSAASDALLVRLVTGTGTDQGAHAMFNGTWTSFTKIDDSKTLSPDFQQFSATIAVPAAATQIGLQFNVTPAGTAGADDWFEITGVQLEAGSAPGAFETFDPALELLACQRFAYRIDNSYGGEMPIATLEVVSSTDAEGMLWRHPVRMRAAPTITPSANADMRLRAAGTSADVAAVVSWTPTTLAVAGQFTRSSTPIVPGETSVLVLKDAGYIDVSAEMV